MLSLGGLQWIDVAKMRPEPLGQVPQPRRLVAELDHVQYKRIDPGSLVHEDILSVRLCLCGASTPKVREAKRFAGHETTTRALQARWICRRPPPRPKPCSGRACRRWSSSSGLRDAAGM